MFEGLSEEVKKNMFISSLNKGDVLLKDFEEAEHQKFFIIAGKSTDKVFVCSIFINSRIHPSLTNKPKLLALQIPIKKSENNFLQYDSYANCAYPMILNTEEISAKYLSNECRVIGTISSIDLITIQSTLINSGLLSEDEIETFLR